MSRKRARVATRWRGDERAQARDFSSATITSNGSLVLVCNVTVHIVARPTSGRPTCPLAARLRKPSALLLARSSTYAGQPASQQAIQLASQQKRRLQLESLPSESKRASGRNPEAASGKRCTGGSTLRQQVSHCCCFLSPAHSSLSLSSMSSIAGWLATWRPNRVCMELSVSLLLLPLLSADCRSLLAD